MKYKIIFNQNRVKEAIALWHNGGPANDAIKILEEQLEQINNTHDSKLDWELRKIDLQSMVDR